MNTRLAMPSVWRIYNACRSALMEPLLTTVLCSAEFDAADEISIPPPFTLLILTTSRSSPTRANSLLIPLCPHFTFVETTSP